MSTSESRHGYFKYEYQVVFVSVHRHGQKSNSMHDMFIIYSTST